MKAKLRKTFGEKFASLMVLGIVMLFIGIFTVFAALNTYEVIARKDIPGTNVIEEVVLTNDDVLNNTLQTMAAHTYQEGSFGIPKKMKLPESNRHIELTDVLLENGKWKASKGIGHVFIGDDNRQKVFGLAIIYLRINTATTQNLGDVFRGDIINIVTTEGWQLGYQVTDISRTFEEGAAGQPKRNSEIIIVLIDNRTDEQKVIRAELSKVGDRI